jgi:geranylgeranyl pyrophosphate synthase
MIHEVGSARVSSGPDPPAAPELHGRAEASPQSERAVEALFRGWEPGALMLGGIDISSGRGSLHRIAQATARAFAPGADLADLDPVLATAVQILHPIRAMLHGEDWPVLRAYGPLRTALLCAATSGLLLERVTSLDRPERLRRQALALLGHALVNAAAGQDWEALSEGGEAAWWRALSGRAGAGGAAAARLGLLFAGGPEPAGETVAAFGGALGRLGQIEHDIMDCAAEPPTGVWRRPGSNLLMLHATAPGMPHAEELRRLIRDQSGPEQRNAARRRLLEGGAIAHAAQAGAACVARAEAALGEIDPRVRPALTAELEACRGRLAAATGTALPQMSAADAPGDRADLAALPWPLLEDMRPVLAKARAGAIAGWARSAAAAAGAPAEAAEPAVEILAQLIAGRVLDDWQDGEEGLHSRIGPARTANLVIGLVGSALALTAELPLEGGRWRAAAMSLARGIAVTVRGQDLDLTAPLSEAGYWQVCDAKTPPLISTALELGALLGGADPALAGALAEAGAPIGRALQVSDDVHDALAMPPSGDWARPERNLVLLYGVTAPGGEAFRRLASQSDDPDQHRAARACLLPDALLYATHAIGAMAARAEAIVGALPLAAPEPILNLIRSFRRVADELRRATIMVNGGTT